MANDEHDKLISAKELKKIIDENWVENKHVYMPSVEAFERWIDRTPAVHPDATCKDYLQVASKVNAELLAACEDWVKYFDRHFGNCEEADPIREAMVKVHGDRVSRSRSAIANAKKLMQEGR